MLSSQYPYKHSASKMTESCVPFAGWLVTTGGESCCIRYIFITQHSFLSTAVYILTRRTGNPLHFVLEPAVQALLLTYHTFLIFPPQRNALRLDTAAATQAQFKCALKFTFKLHFARREIGIWSYILLSLSPVWRI